MIAIIDYGVGNLQSVLNAFKILTEDVIITKEEVVQKKPNPEVYNKIVERHCIKDKSKCLVIEDSLTGVTAARHAGLHVIGIFDQYSSKDINEIKNYVDCYFNNYEEIINYFKLC